MTFGDPQNPANEQARKFFEDAQSQAQQFFDEAETALGAAMEQLVSGENFAEMLALMTDNFIAMKRINDDAADLVVRNMRLAGRQDIVRLAEQLGRTEDKLEMVLQAVEHIASRLDEREKPRKNGTPSLRSTLKLADTTGAASTEPGA
jgi:hypothetical protein